MNFKTFLAFIFVFLITSCSPTTKLAYSPKPSVVEIGKSSTVAFVAESTNKNNIIKPYCTGVWINNDTLLTALHCAQGAATMVEIKKLPLDLRKFAPLFIKRVQDPTGIEMSYITENEVVGLEEKPKNTYTSIVVAIDENHDLALLKAKKNIPNHNWLRISNYMPKVGDKVYVIGHQGGLYFTVMDGMVAAIRETYPIDLDDDFNIQGPLIQVFSSIYYGNSGGPIISQNGEIIGIVSFIAKAPNQGFGIAPPSIKQFIMKSHYERLL